MNFYIGNSIEEILIHDLNVELEDKLVEFLYSIRKKIPEQRNKLYEIDPYDDILLTSDETLEIINVCHYILEQSLLDKYEEKQDAEEALKGLIYLGEKAVKNKKGMVSIGD